MTFDLPRPGAPHIDNLIATLLIAGNSLHTLKPEGLARIAHYQGFDLGEFNARFGELETRFKMQPRNYEEIEE